MGNLILGYGLLGKEMVTQTGWDYKCREKGFDILTADFEKEFVDYIDLPHAGRVGYSTPPAIINCIANTDTYSDDKKSHWDVNYASTARLVDFCNEFNIKLVHISTDHIYVNSSAYTSEDEVPVHSNNWYGYTKLLADGYIELKSNNYLTVRCCHKPNPFPYEFAWDNQIGNFDTVDNICKIVVDLINKKENGIYNIGTDIKSMYDFAKKTNPNVKPSEKPKRAPSDITMNISKLKKL